MSTHALDEGSKNTLELFVERTEALAQFVSENRFGGGLVGIFRNVNEGEWQIHSAINGSLCILRSFLQSSDGIALYLLERDSPQGPLRRPKLLDLNVSASWHDTVNHAYEQINLALAIEPDNLTYNGKAISRFEVLDTFLYGKFVHLTTEKRNKYNQWKSEPELFDRLKGVFIDSLGFIVGQIMEVAKASKYELDLYTRNAEP